MSATPRYRDTRTQSFLGQFLLEQAVPEDHFIRALKCLFDWQELGESLIGMYPGRGLYGRAPHDPVLMFKMLFLSYLYDLSERDTERFVNENIPARYFLDLAVDVKAPDHSCLTVFKNRLLENGVWDELQSIFDGLRGQAKDHGLEFGHVQILDSVHTQADINAKKDKERQEKGGPSRDPEARMVHKGKRVVVEPDGKRVKKDVRCLGYKTHVSMDAKTRIPTSILPAFGNSADNKAFPYLFAHDRSLGLPTTIYAGDKAYDDTDIFERIEQAGMHVGITLRRFRTSKKDPNKQRWQELKETPEYQEGTKLRYRVEQPFGQAKDKHGFERCRYLGLLKYGIQSYLTFMVVAAKRIVKLLTGITFRQLAKGRRKEVFEPVYDMLPWA
jgi:IS5 family transposase